MQKALRENLLTRNQLLKQGLRKTSKKIRQEWRDYKREQVARNRVLRDAVKTERKTRREDWICGPFAPMRDVGEKQGLYGTASHVLFQPPRLPSTVRPRRKHILLAVGDRVAVARGNEQGKIGEIKEIDYNTNTALVEDVNVVDSEIPRWSNEARLANRTRIARNIPVPIPDLRLVYPMTREDGTTRDVVIRHLYGGPPKIERDHGSNIPSHTRYVSGLDIEIPWPEEQVRDSPAEAPDMPRLEVEKITFYPSLIDKPLPEGVEDEFQNKRKRGRGRHDHKWMGWKIIQDAERIWRENRKMQTPQEEYHEARLRKKQANDPVAVTEETLQDIRSIQALNLKDTGRAVGAAS